MSIDRVATNNQTSYMLSQIAKANVKLQQSEYQVTTGKNSSDYAGIGDKTAALEGARAAAERAKGYAASTQLAMTQTDLQNTQLTTLTGLASQLQKAVRSAVSKSDGTGLMTTAKSIFDQATAILNAKDSNGNYIYGGEISDQPPFTATSLSDLVTQPSVSSFFQNGTVKKSVTVGDGQTETIGVLASDIGTDLMNALKALYQEDQSTSLSGSITETQIGNLSNNVTPKTDTAYKNLNAVTAQNGNTYTTLKNDVTNQQSLQNLYTGFVSDIEDADMATALTNLSNNQTALQAVLTVTSKLNDLTLLNFLPASG
ncbi:flagellin [Rhizomicrobium electricum]|jgi:flagellar hook-associated protein 3 FlgL|uniref:Flagellin C-terminal domain-containing protein n=1 Tax=Rhizomicrobium electricum TaxID=480070 RepID=A0ABP3PZD8_9PROT|nr:flagellin [Rhizomicrobium electricum]NIJ49558.1 flagellar hook-associated protein 3 FlgL [Rhizomicrobium electricum]